MEYWVLARERVVPRVVAERALEPAFPWVHVPFEDDLRVRRHLDVDRLTMNHLDPAPTEPAREDDLVKPGRERGGGRVDRGGVATERDRDLHAIEPDPLGLALVLRRALVGLPVHAECPIIEDLETVHTDVASARRGVTREDERKRDVAPRVARPAGEDR